MTKILCTLVLLGSATSAFAAGAKQCQTYADACKAENSIKQTAKDQKIAAIHTCILAKATAAGAAGQACVKEQSGHKQ